MLPKSASDSFLPWETGSDRNALHWIHDGTQDCPPYVVHEFSTPFCRTATTIVHVNGKAVPHVLKRRLEPQPWNIVLMGARAGVVAVEFDSNLISYEVGEGLLRDATRGRGHLNSDAETTELGRRFIEFQPQIAQTP